MLEFIARNSPFIVFVIITFQIVMFFINFWQHKAYEMGFLGLCIVISLAIWVKIYDMRNKKW